ncbi:olfactory receptor 1G1-like [Cygnus olor]|uniref:olfactory receptor 1G1-like n=1 Tax=Cygnus olor TaxID=8869 RepID=UPI001ADE4BC6|nr:olfactory receptor 1G1-like [Cygnus olor]
MSNSSSITEFLLLAFADTRELQLLHFGLFLGIYPAALLGNGLILTAIACDHRLHTPMYFFLLNLTLIDLGCISTTLPKAMVNSLWDTKDISYQGCAARVLFLVLFFDAEYSLIAVMAYDRYVAICKPLIFRLVLRMPSVQGQHKAVSTCLPHLDVVSLFLSTIMFAHLKPTSISSRSLDLVVSFLYSVVHPAVNPLIYSMRNQELKGTTSTTLRQTLASFLTGDSTSFAQRGGSTISCTFCMN